MVVSYSVCPHSFHIEPHLCIHPPHVPALRPCVNVSIINMHMYVLLYIAADCRQIVGRAELQDVYILSQGIAGRAKFSHTTYAICRPADYSFFMTYNDQTRISLQAAAVVISDTCQL